MSSNLSIFATLAPLTRDPRLVTRDYSSTILTFRDVGHYRDSSTLYLITKPEVTRKQRVPVRLGIDLFRKLPSLLPGFYVFKSFNLRHFSSIDP